MKQEKEGGLVPPVEVGGRYEVVINSLGNKGDGVTAVDRFIVIVPGTRVGETVLVEVTRVMQKYAFAVVKERR